LRSNATAARRGGSGASRTVEKISLSSDNLIECAMVDLLEVFKVVGAAGGLTSAGFLIYDRLVRSRPEAFLNKGEYPGQVLVVVRNVSAESIILDRIAVAPNILGVALGNNAHSMAEIIEARYEREKRSSRKVFIVLKPLEAVELHLITFDKFENALSIQKVTAEISWRTTRFRLPFQRNIKITTSVADIKAMKRSARNDG
jgi:hypothetical protein